MNSPINRAEHEEFRRRMEEHHKRQDKRLSLLEENIKDIQALAVSVEKLAANIETMCQELAQQGKRLDAVENRDGEMWRQLKYYLITAFISMSLGFLATSVSK